MELEEYPLLNTPALILVLLKTATSADATLADAMARLRSVLRLAGEEPPVSSGTIRLHLHEIGLRMTRAGLLEWHAGERIRITARGADALAAHPAGFDFADLSDAAEMRRRLLKNGQRAIPSDPRSGPYGAGFDAFRAGGNISDNPHQPDTADHRAWQDGWCQARDDTPLRVAA